MTSTLLLAVPAGVGLGLGLWVLLALVPRVGAAPLRHRVAPYLAHLSAEAREVAERRVTEPTALLTGLASPGVARIRRLLVAALGGEDAVARRLRQAGRETSVAAFRSWQLAAGALGLALGIAVSSVGATLGTVSPPFAVALPVIAAAVGVVVPDQLLARAARARQARMAEELPTVLEFLSLSLSAGESVLDALRRVAATGTGELARELGRVVVEVNAGSPLADSLTRCGAVIGLPSLTRTLDQLVAALERGTPLVDVFRAQAQDSRDDAKRRLLEAAGRKEVAMLVPLVFLILPVTIAFALFPATLVLDVGF